MVVQLLKTYFQSQNDHFTRRNMFKPWRITWHKMVVQLLKKYFQ